MSLAASWLIIVIVILRLVLGSTPKWGNVLLWSIVAIRLICPFTIESPVSLIPSSIGNGELVSEWADSYIGDIDIHHLNSVNYDAAIGAGREPVSDSEGCYYVVTKHDQLGEPDTIQNTVIPILSVVWLTGIGTMFLCAAISYIQLRKRVGASIPLQDRILICDDIQTPFILGIFKSRIYIPSGTNEVQLPHIIAHENAHLKRHDNWWKPLGYFVLAIHWFNPLVWISYIFLCRDIELACDEKVIRELNQHESIAYSEALLSCSMNRRTVMVCPLSFGEVSVKERVKHVLNYKKPAFWIIVVALLSCIVIAVCFLTDPKKIHLENIVEENGYAITSQERYDFTLSIPKDKLPDTIYEPGGHQFKKDEMIVYHTDTTNVYLECVMPSNETEDQLYFIFNFSYNLPQSGKILVPHYRDNNGFSAGINLRNKTLFTQTEQYTDAVRIRAQGPDEQFSFYVSTDACRSATGSLMMDVFCWEWTYYSDKEDGMITPIKLLDYPMELDTAISSAIMEYNKNKYLNGAFTCESHTVLTTETEQNNTLTVYALALYEEFNLSEEGIQNVSGGCSPIALTFNVTPNEYELSEYWEPGDGSQYTNDIRKKFPENALDKFWNLQNYDVDALKAENEQKALEFWAQKKMLNKNKKN